MPFDVIENPNSVQITIPASRNPFIPIVIIGMAISWGFMIISIGGSQISINWNYLILMGVVLLCSIIIGKFIKRNVLEFKIARFVFVFLVFGMVFLLPYFPKNISREHTHNSALWWSLENILTNWLIIVSILVYGFWSLWAKEVILIGKGKLVVKNDFFGFGSIQEFELPKMEDVEVFSRKPFYNTSYIKYPNRISFNYEGNKFFIANVGINENEAEQI